MKKYSALLAVLLSFVFTCCAIAEPLVYEDFESYVVGYEGSYETGDLWLNWWYGEEGNPYLRAYADDAVSYTGNKSMRLDAPLRDGGTNYNGTPSSAEWGVQIMNDGTTTDVNEYNKLTAMVKANDTSSITMCALVARDAFGLNLNSLTTYISVPNDGNWHKIYAILDGTGDKTILREILPFFSIAANAPTGIPQLWIDDIKFERVLAINDIVDVDVNGPYGCADGTVKLSMVMTQQPSADVDFTIDPNVTLNFGAGFGNPVNIVFTNSNWNIRREVVVDINSSAFSIQTVAVTASSTDPNLIDVLPSNFSIPILGKYGASYVISPETPTANWDGSDNTGIDLANGRVESMFYVPFSWDWVEWAPSEVGAPAYADIIFDFVNAKDINSIDIRHTGGESELYPGSFEISYSTDGISYSTPTEYEAYIGTGYVATTHIDVSSVNARYVKMRVHCVDDNPAKWFFLSEVLFNYPVDARKFPRYTIDPGNIPLGNHKDPYQENLMNGVISYASTSADWVYFDNASLVPYNNVILYVDYGEVKEFSNLSMNYSTGTSMSTPAEVKLSFGSDGINYGTPISLTGWYAEGTSGKGRTDAKTFTPQTGQYVKVEIVGNGTYSLVIGEIILTNRPQMTYVVDSTTPVYGATGSQGDIATEYYLQRLKFGDLANTHIPTVIGAYSDPDWVEWAPNQNGIHPAYALITFDLKSIVKVKNVAIVYCAWPSTPPSGVRVPGGLEAAFSTNGTTFSTMTDVGAVFSDNASELEIFNTTFALPETQARYVKLKIRCYNNDPANWLYIAEVKFNVFDADINDDGGINFEDLKMMSSQWLRSGGGLSADIAGGDGKVNFQDFAKFALEWMY